LAKEIQVKRPSAPPFKTTGPRQTPDMGAEFRGEKPPTFASELESLINRYSQENGSNTPDFILAEYLQGCLEAFNKTVEAREKWYGRWPGNGSLGLSVPESTPEDPASANLK
jgi:hypothetical protein